MKGEWCYFKSYFSKSMCEDIIEEAKKLPSQKAAVGDGDLTHYDEQIRKSEVSFINASHKSFDFLYDEIWRRAIEANHLMFNFHITKLDFIQFAKYEASENGEYKKHQDVFWINGDPIYHRKLTCLIQLSDPNDYEGGEFELSDISEYPDPEDIKQQGTMIFIPSFVYHQANRVTKGTRYSIAAWIDGPKWS